MLKEYFRALTRRFEKLHPAEQKRLITITCIGAVGYFNLFIMLIVAPSQHLNHPYRELASTAFLVIAFLCGWLSAQIWNDKSHTRRTGLAVLLSCGFLLVSYVAFAMISAS
ncbi:MAG: hypothetical protein K2X93_06030 [Candidatus Obscuribacterales bacterium]|nr:hypothetical protein [Candidatus Obscuribacterales bacterium]